MGQRIIQVDAFTSERFRGNPAAICVLDAQADAGWMQRVANEMNLSETAFLVPQGPGEFELRWFTPTVEVELCGHATVAAAHVLWNEGIVPLDLECRFNTRSGRLTARRSAEWIEVEFPLENINGIEPPADAMGALGVDAIAAAESTRLGYLLLELASESDVRRVCPDFSLLSQAQHGGVIVTSRAENGTSFDFVSRFFAPQKGVNEDPATGSAHCVLGPYWAPRLGRTALKAYQASARGAEIRVRVGRDRVTLSGHAVTVLRGELV